MLPPAVLIQIDVAGERNGWLPATKDAVLSGVVSSLSAWPLPVLASKIDVGNELYGALTFQWLHWQYTATLTVSTPSDTFDTVDDVASAVRDAFTEAAGEVPTSIQARIVRSTPNVPAPDGASFIPDLKFDVGAGLLLVVGVVVLIIVAIGWGKNIKVAAIA